MREPRIARTTRIGGKGNTGRMRYQFPCGTKERRVIEAVVVREDCGKGFFVSFDYPSDALAEIQAFFKRTSEVISPSPSAKSSTNTSP